MFKRGLLRTMIFLLLLMLLGGHLLAQSTFEIPAWTVDGGGGTSQGSTFTLHGTLSQPDAGVLAGGEFRLYGGIWGHAPGSSPSPQGLFLPAISSE